MAMFVLLSLLPLQPQLQLHHLYAVGILPGSPMALCPGLFVLLVTPAAV